MRKGKLEYHGPTSIHLDEDFEDKSETYRMQNPSPATDAWKSIRLAQSLGINDGLIRATMPLFFLNHYPQLMFVYREAFLADYYDHAYGGKYWSYPLVYALCALGAAHSTDPSVRSKSYLLAKCAQEIIITYDLATSSITTVQALLLLAFHEIGQGNSSKGWLFSGK